MRYQIHRRFELCHLADFTPSPSPLMARLITDFDPAPGGIRLYGVFLKVWDTRLAVLLRIRRLSSQLFAASIRVYTDRVSGSASRPVISACMVCDTVR